MGWWTDWFIPLLIASAVLLIFKDGIGMTVFLWVVYLINGWRTVKAFPNTGNDDEFSMHLVIGIIVVVASFIFRIIVAMMS